MKIIDNIRRSWGQLVRHHNNFIKPPYDPLGAGDLWGIINEQEEKFEKGGDSTPAAACQEDFDLGVSVGVKRGREFALGLLREAVWHKDDAELVAEIMGKLHYWGGDSDPSNDPPKPHGMFELVTSIEAHLAKLAGCVEPNKRNFGHRNYLATGTWNDGP